MNAVLAPIPVITQISRHDLPGIGAPLGGGFYAGLYREGDTVRAIIVSPKAGGDLADRTWSQSRDLLKDAQSFSDGLANTEAMLGAGSALAKEIRDLRIGDANDWHLPAVDQLEVIYRNLKPTAAENYCYCGSNVSALPPTQRYMPDVPAQTAVDAFKTGGAEAFDEDDWYWTSTQYAGGQYSAWFQFFGYGDQVYGLKANSYRARAVRSLLVIE